MISTREYVCADSETFRIEPGLAAPPMVCLSHCNAFTENVRGVELVLAPLGLSRLRSWLERGWLIVGANTAFDLAVACAADPSLLPLVFEAYRLGNIEDVLLTEQLIRIAEGTFKFAFDHDTGEWQKSEYDLAALAEFYCGFRLNKGADTWRTRYDELAGKPIAEWPVDAQEYAMADSWMTKGIFLGQRPAREELIPESVRIQQNRAAWALELMSVWGLRTDPERVTELRTRLTTEVETKRAALVAEGFYRFKHKIKRPSPLVKTMAVIRARVSTAFAGAPPMTDPTKDFPLGQVKCDEETLRASKDPLLEQLADVLGTEKLLNTFVPILELGTRHPINARMNTLVSSGRTSVSKPPLQQLPRKGGIRECFVPRAGRKFVTSDYDTGELRTLAQVCLILFGFSRMAEALRRGEDLHLRLASEILVITYEEAARRLKEEDGSGDVTDTRQFAKIANFGLPGGMVPETLVDYAKQYGVSLTLEKSREICAAWARAWPEMALYFRHIKSLVGFTEATVKSFGLPMLRGGVGYCDGCNHNFQNLLAQIFKEALWRVSWESYVGTLLADGEHDLRVPSPLRGARPVVPMHDEIMIEVEDHPTQRSIAGDRLSKVMIEAASSLAPDVPFTCSPALMDRWYKGAKTVRDASGLLVPWSPPSKAKLATASFLDAL